MAENGTQTQATTFQACKPKIDCMRLPAATFAFATCAAFAQAPAERPAFDAFEVATIKPSAPDAIGRYIRMQSAHELIAHNHTLKTLIAAAYNQSPQAISGGPAWVDSEHFEILAKTPGEARPRLEEQMAMLRALLAERFHLTFHREPKELPYYALTVARGGPKLNDTAITPDTYPEGPPALVIVLSPPAQAALPARYATMTDLASVLQRAALPRPVLDKTGLTGRYDFTLEWLPDETQFNGAARWEAREDSKPDLFSALQRQLGLKLEAAKGPVDVFVIDRAEQPSGN